MFSILFNEDVVLLKVLRVSKLMTIALCFKVYFCNSVAGVVCSAEYTAQTGSG